MIDLATISPLVDIGRSLREAFFMFWETLWALALGFSLSGVVQAFVSKETMQEKLGNHRPAAVSRAAGYGMVSSSCSYAASAPPAVKAFTTQWDRWSSSSSRATAWRARVVAEIWSRMSMQ